MDQVSVAGPYFDSDDMASLLEPHFEDLSTGPTANLPLTDQVCHLCWIPLWARKQKKKKNHHNVSQIQLNVVSVQTVQA